MDEERQLKSGNTSQAFVVGVIIGVALTLLFTTKKGRKLLKTITDGGMEKLEKWEEVLYKQTPETDEVEVAEEIIEGDDYEAGEEMKEEQAPKHVSHEAVKHALKTDGSSEHKTSPKRFFKGAKK